MIEKTAAKSLLLSQIPRLYNIAAQGLLSYEITQAPILSNEQLLLGSVGFLLIATAIGSYVEKKALDKRHYSNNPVTTVIYNKIHSPWIAIGLGTAFGYISDVFSNPVDMTGISQGMTGEGRFFWANLLAKTIIGFSYSVLANTAIKMGVLEKIKLEKIKL